MTGTAARPDPATASRVRPRDPPSGRPVRRCEHRHEHEHHGEAEGVAQVALVEEEAHRPREPEELDGGGPLLDRAHEVAERAGEAQHGHDEEHLACGLDGQDRVEQPDEDRGGEVRHGHRAQGVGVRDDTRARVGAEQQHGDDVTLEEPLVVVVEGQEPGTAQGHHRGRRQQQPRRGEAVGRGCRQTSRGRPGRRSCRGCVGHPPHRCRCPSRGADRSCGFGDR